jgi:hypothetical protein
MIKLKFDANSNTVDVLRYNNVIMSLDPEDFGSLIREVKRIMEEASPSIAKNARKRDRRMERRQLINQLKIMLAIKLIDFWRWVKSIFKKKTDEKAS